MSDSNISLDNIKSASRKVVLAYVGLLVSVYEAGRDASGSSKARFSAQQAKINPLFEELIARGKKVQADGKTKLEELRVSAGLAESGKKVSA